MARKANPHHSPSASPGSDSRSARTVAKMASSAPSETPEPSANLAPSAPPETSAPSAPSASLRRQSAPVWIKEHCRVNTRGKGPQPLRAFSYQRLLWKDRSRQRIVLKSRQMGVSRALACEAAYLALNRPGSTILIVSRGLAAARNVGRYIWQSIAYDIHQERLPAPTYRNSTSIEWEDIESRIVCLPASEDAARSYSATDVYLDEAAYLPWADEIYQALAPTVSTGGRMTVVSTPHGRGNLFHRLWESEPNWSHHRIHWRDRPEYTEEWAALEKARHTDRSWAEEYELKFESSGNDVFSETHILAIITSERRPPEPPFFAGLDLARHADWTALLILDSKGDVLELDRFNQATWTIQIDRCLRTLEKYPGVRVVCDATGAGDPVVELIQAQAAALPDRAIHAEPFLYTAESRGPLLNELVLAVEHQSISIPKTAAFEILVGEMRVYQWTTTSTGKARADHPRNGHDDCIQALALAYHALSAHRNHPPRTAPALVMTGAAGMRRW